MTIGRGWRRFLDAVFIAAVCLGYAWFFLSSPPPVPVIVAIVAGAAALAIRVPNHRSTPTPVRIPGWALFTTMIIGFVGASQLFRRAGESDTGGLAIALAGVAVMVLAVAMGRILGWRAEAEQRTG
jgi:hypothetical protein